MLFDNYFVVEWGFDGYYFFVFIGFVFVIVEFGVVVKLKVYLRLVVFIKMFNVFGMYGVGFGICV